MTNQTSKPPHVVVMDLWKRRVELDALIEELDKATWQHIDDGAHMPYHMLGNEASGAFVMILAGRTSFVWRLEAHPNTQMIRPVTDSPVLTALETTKENAREAVRKSLVASREAFNSIANWLQIKDLGVEPTSVSNEEPDVK
jgi:hypothetical protein